MPPRPLRRAILAPAFLLFTGVVALLVATALSQKRGTALSMPIDLRPGVTRSAPFSADYAEPYEVGLAVRRIVDTDETQCRLGVRPLFDTGRPDTCARPSRVALTWTIYEDGEVHARGGSAENQFASYSDTITRMIGRAPLSPGHSYVLEVRSLDDARELAAGGPHITVAVHPAVTTDAMAHDLLLTLTAVVATSAGLGWLLFELAANAAARRRRSP